MNRQLDLIIRGGTIVDGTGSAGYRGEVGVKDGRIVALGEVTGTANTEIDAAGLIVAPGFIDCHTHYDAQLSWDRMLSPSVYHGVTTVIAGNCGFTLAPLSGKQADLDYLLPMLARVEGMPLRTLELAIKPTWNSFGEFLDTIDGTLAVNTAFLAGHTTIRRHVMGERAIGHEATQNEIAEMAELLRSCLEQGATGFSSTGSLAHSDHNGDPVPSRFATDEEILALCAVVKEFPGTWLESNLGGLPWQQQKELFTAMSLTAKRALNWNLLVARAEPPELLEEQVDIQRYAAARGARVYALTPAIPLRNVLNFRTGMLLEMLEGWHDFIHLSHEDKLQAMRDPAERERLEEGARANYRSAGMCEDFGDLTIDHVGSEENSRWIGCKVSELAQYKNTSGFDALFDLAVEENLAVSFSPPEIAGDEADWPVRGRMWRDPYCLIGGSDAGAHVDAINTFAVSTQLLGRGVREQGLLTIEEGVQALTSRPADVFGLKDRGRLANGAAADIVVFDPATVNCGPITMRNDLPGNETRLYADAIGIKHVIVNGVPVASDNQPTGSVGGKVLRSGVDTYTVPISGTF